MAEEPTHISAGPDPPPSERSVPLRPPPEAVAKLTRRVVSQAERSRTWLPSCPHRSYRWADAPVGKRHLIYHLYPLIGSPWRQRVQALVARWPLFTGAKFIACATGPTAAAIGEVRAALPPDAQLVEVANVHNPTGRERVSWLPLWEAVLNVAADEDAVARMHGKGVNRPDYPACQLWAEVGEAVMLDHWPLVEEHLRRVPVTGVFKEVHDPNWNGEPGCDWHYAGSHYWLRAGDVRHHRDWRGLFPNSWGVESWPGREYRRDEAGCLFFPATGRELGHSLYTLDAWEKTYLPAYRLWQAVYPPAIGQPLSRTCIGEAPSPEDDEK